jgi:hypothetical protein
MTEAIIILEVTEAVWAELSAAEKAGMLAKYADTQVLPCAMHVFNLLRKKFQPNYRMGKMYENLSDKYKFFDQLYKEYTQKVNAGYTSPVSETYEQIDVDRFRAD